MTHPHYIDLASCPFCGSADVEVRDVTDETWKAAFQVACNNCGSRTGIGTHKPEAIAAWNRRPAPMEAVAWRLRRVDVERWNLWDLDPRVDTPAYADASKWTVQALAVILTPASSTTPPSA